VATETKKKFEFTIGVPQTILYVLLLVCAFLIGSLTTKVQYLESIGKPVAGSADESLGPSTQGQAAPQPQAAKDFPQITADDHVRGDRNAPIALVEYTDFECPYCKTFHPTTKQIVDAYKGKVMLVFRHFPLAFHANAQKEAEASECASELGGNDAFWKYVDAIFDRTTSNGTGFSLDALVPLAGEIGLSTSTFQACLDSGKYTQKVKDEENAGAQAGITGTPGNIILNVKTGETQLIPGALPFESFKTVIDKMLAST
jgi:protein-disulfide isomerase